jgi:hypothetical protein
MSASATYEFAAVLLFSTSVAQPIAFGLTFPALAGGGGVCHRALSAVMTAPTQSIVNAMYGEWTDAGSGSILLSAPAPGVAGPHAVVFNGVFMVSNANGVLQIQAKASTGTGAIVFSKGSYMKLYKL